MRAPIALSCAALLAAANTGCLITDSPQFQVPQHTAPFLVASSALPDVRGVVIDDAAALMDLTFSADVISQDDPAGSGGQFTTVVPFLYIDYGFNTVPGQPYTYQFPGDKLAPGGTLDQTSGRLASATWRQSPGVGTVPPGCHTATLIVSHIFDQVPVCPVCDDDFSTLTWFVLSCDSSLGTCGDLPLTSTATLTGCPSPSTLSSCETALADAGATETACPETTSGTTN